MAGKAGPRRILALFQGPFQGKAAGDERGIMGLAVSGMGEILIDHADAVALELGIVHIGFGTGPG